jgi:hypothetical protein
MKRFMLLSWLLATLINPDLISQSRSEIKNNFYDAESWILFEDYKEALPLYQFLLKIYPTNSNYKYRIGQCYLNTPGEKDKAVSYLEDASKNINPKYKEGKFSETGAPYDALYYLANAYRINNQLDRAIDTYKLFQKNLNPDVYDTTVVFLQIQSCLNAKELMSLPLYVKQTNLGSPINANNSEFNPVISDNENLIVFSRSEAFYDAILFSTKINGKWSEPRNMNELLKVDKDLFPTSLSKDGKDLYLYSSADYDGIIYTSRFENNTWSPLVKLNENINTKFWESHATISHDNNKLFFTSNRKSTLGGLDIYVSKRDSTGDWGPAENLGPVINTPYNEESPFLSQDDKTLFFSSRGHFNMGGYDIFYSHLYDNGEWSVPLNVGYPMNSTDDDVFYNPLHEGYQGYFAIDASDGLGKQDIYHIDIFSDKNPRKFTVRGMVKVAELINNARDSVKISAMNIKNPNQTVVAYSNPQTGEYEFQIPQGNYEITYEGKGAERVVKNLEILLTNPSDSFILGETILPKADFSADLDVGINKSMSVENGDTIIFPLKLEPKSLLTVEHWVGDSLLSAKHYPISDSTFNYKIVPDHGENRVIFKLTDKFNNSASADIYITRKKDIAKQPLIRSEYISPVTDGRINQEEASTIAADIITDIDPSILIIREKILAFSEKSEDGSIIQKSVATIDLNNIKQAGKWLQAYYDEAVKQGLTNSQIAEMLVIISSSPDTDVEQFLRDLIEHSEEPLFSSLRSLALSKEKIKAPMDLVLFLLINRNKEIYTEKAIFNGLASLIAAKDIPPDSITSRFTTTKDRKTGILLILIAAGLCLIFFLLWKRKKNNKK